MRRIIILAIAVVAAACSSSSEPLAFDLSHTMEFEEPPVPFAVAGASADEGMVCADGTFTREVELDPDGLEISGDEWNQMFDQAIQTGGVAEMTSVKEFSCADGSGTLIITEDVRFDFGVIDLEAFGTGEFVGSTWTIEGIGEYADLTGSGEAVIDFDEMVFHYRGEVGS